MVPEPSVKSSDDFRPEKTSVSDRTLTPTLESVVL